MKSKKYHKLVFRNMGTQNGTVLFGAVILIVIVGMLSVLLITYVSTKEVVSSRGIWSKKVLYSAHAGVEYALRYASDHPAFLEAPSQKNLNFEGTTITLDYEPATDTLTSNAQLINGRTSTTIRINYFSEYVP